jgi:hypothetical protein
MSMDNPRTHAEREAAQRADEAAADEILRRYTLEMDAILMDTRAHILNQDTPPRHRHLCPQCGAAWIHELDRCPHGIYHGCDTCRPYDPGDDEAAWLPMAGGSGAPRCPDCGESGVARDCEPCVVVTEHTHPCPTCRHERSCACTTFVPGEPLECATCSNCRGW